MISGAEGGRDTARRRHTPPVAADATTKPSPLSVQVRAMRQVDGRDQSVQRNVSEAFDAFMRRVDEIYSASSPHAPAEFDRRINYWHATCGMPGETRTLLQTLRIWRNASLHHDAARWARDGPRSEKEASQHLARLESLVTVLEQREQRD